MSSQTAVAGEVDMTPVAAENGGPATFFERVLDGVRGLRRDGSEIDVPAKVRETRYAALGAMGLAMLHSLLSITGGLPCVIGSVGHFFAAWVTGGVALLFGLRSRWIWVTSLGLASLQAFLGIFTLVAADMPTGVGPFTVLFGVMVSGVVLALLLRRDCYRWFTPASPELQRAAGCR
ncbi:hypothetical protein [Nocardia aurantiaca]|uniref:Uncharacterized protein n=1 Tax=Nocardia aurantiaca TaxID=2675850 RepID=A0A6I3L1D4_9NOCA|nr:hypothetical protein [Nocardia aurantiaca]MTE15068.1 hypothetical protein [Nocardia aurantiaca]